MLNSLPTAIQSFMQSGTGTTVTLVLTLLMGIVYCFFGYRALRVICTIIGFCVGLVVGVAVASAVKVSSPWDIVIVVACAVVVAVLGFLLYRVGVFLEVMLGAWSIIYTVLTQNVKLETTYIVIISLVAAFALAILAAIYLRPVIIVVTALSGGLMFSEQLFTNLIHVRWNSTMELACRLGVGLILAVLGMLYQFNTTDDN